MFGAGDSVSYTNLFAERFISCLVSFISLVTWGAELIGGRCCTSHGILYEHTSKGRGFMNLSRSIGCQVLDSLTVIPTLNVTSLPAFSIAYTTVSLLTWQVINSHPRAEQANVLVLLYKEGVYTRESRNNKVTSSLNSEGVFDSTSLAFTWYIH
ncbi:hypothetical protein BKA58DRAFT_128410 [Alternaria rosae]|uniref:uncharacterized protein n=1 Tax=Alternaria rosae TaxID=1187941 RepID=UPI001E8D3E71|nr:uncharacterized protein BKA58DRAFT_128410 [Alternaria rosae]KAH6875763.1 hypothetical protein BKA58DRAFT_128410 [Alternaria rosae]